VNHPLPFSLCHPSILSQPPSLCHPLILSLRVILILCHPRSCHPHSLPSSFSAILCLSFLTLPSSACHPLPAILRLPSLTLPSFACHPCSLPSSFFAISFCRPLPACHPLCHLFRKRQKNLEGGRMKNPHTRQKSGLVFFRLSQQNKFRTEDGKNGRHGRHGRENILRLYLR